MQFALGPGARAKASIRSRRQFVARLGQFSERQGQLPFPLSPIAIEVVRRIDSLFEIERSINGKSAQERLEVRRRLSRPLVEDLQI